jgi:hypothetical protein
MPCRLQHRPRRLYSGNTVGLLRRAGTAQGSAAQTEPRKCYHCGLTGHIKSECPAVGANANTSVTRGRDGSRGGANFGGNQFGGRPARPDHDKSDDYDHAMFTQSS